MASPHVAGLVGLLWSKWPTSTNKTIRSQLESTAVAIAGTGSLWAKGRINACRAVGGSSC
jgi:thermitase